MHDPRAELCSTLPHSDFDHLVDFPRSAFNAGMKVAQWVDPATFYEEYPPSGRPFIMSPYAACMNTLAAGPAPARASDAIVVLRHTELEDVGASKHGEADVPEGLEDLVPLEVRDRSKKDGRHLVRYWRFLGFRSDGRVQDWLRANAPAVLQAATTPIASGAMTSTRPGMTHQASLGVHPRQAEMPEPSTSGVATPVSPAEPSTAAVNGKPAKKSSGSFGFGALKNALSGVSSGSSSPKPVTAADVRPSLLTLPLSLQHRLNVPSGSLSGNDRRPAPACACQRSLAGQQRARRPARTFQVRRRWR